MEPAAVRSEPDVDDGTTRRASEAPASADGFRPDIDGLRAIAILLVVAYHAHVPGFTGGFVGVDVFFVISGYLITRILLRQTSAGSRVLLLPFWAKRIRRLVPALAVMVIVTLGLSALVLSPFEWTDLPRQAAAAGLYVSNILFARAEVGYFDVHGVESPFLHTWSLGVEEQFYLLWPLLFVGVALVARSALRRRRSLLALFGAGAVVSFALSLWLTRRGSPWAFLSLPTRAWEFAAAGILAGATVPRLLQHRHVRTGAYVTGLLLLGGATVLFHGGDPYPGVRALVPVAATLLLILAGSVSAPGSTITRVLSLAPVQWLGRLSYSWYLWHWPIMIVAVAWLDRDTTTVRVAAGLLALAPAAAAYRWVENPVRFHSRLVVSPVRTIAMGVGVTALVIGASFTFRSYSAHELASDGYRELAAVKDGPRGLDCDPPERSATGIEYCVGGDPTSSTTVMLIGDSHAMQWSRAFSASAERLHVRLVVRAMSVCPSIPLRVTSFEGIEKPDCAAYRNDTRSLIDELRPDAVVVSDYRGYADQILRPDGAHADPAEQAELWRTAFAEQMAALQELGVRVGVVVDNPRLAFDPLVCMSRRGNSEQSCRPSRADALARVIPFERAEQRVLQQTGEVPTFGVTDRICDDAACDLRQNGAFVFRDRDHLAAAWTMQHSRLIDPFLKELNE